MMQPLFLYYVLALVAFTGIHQWSIIVVAQPQQTLLGTPEERNRIIQDAISEIVGGQSDSDNGGGSPIVIGPPGPPTGPPGPPTASTAQSLLNRGFKRPSRIARSQGRLRQVQEELVNVVETRLLRLLPPGVPGPPPSIATGSLLTSAEISLLLEESECIPKQKTKEQCLNIPTVNVYRPIDGSCNNLEKPLQGSSDTSFRRLLKPIYEDFNSQPRGTEQATHDETGYFTPPNPSARHISSTIVNDRNREEVFSHLLMQFGQFLDHDLDLAPELELTCGECNFTEECIPVRVKKDDPKFGISGTTKYRECLPFHRSIAACNPPDQPLLPREQLNVITSYIDGSMIYGSSFDQTKFLRSFQDGLLKTGVLIGDGDSLAIDEDNNVVSCGIDRNDCFLCGDVRCNEQVSLTVIHTLWVREHNRIARRLGKMNPLWSDERIFQEARKIIGGMLQKIVYYDYLPKILDNELFDIVIGRYEKYSADVDASVPNSFATAAFRFGHSLIRPNFPRLKPDYSRAKPDLELVEMFFNPPKYEESDGVGPIARGWVSADAMNLDEFLTNTLTSKLFQTNDSPGLDLATLNIQRQRDHGLPTYGDWRKYCSTVYPELGPAEIENEESRHKLETLHGSVDNAELWVAGLSEKNYPGSIIGPTFACLFGLTFKNLREGDRFYFEKNSVFTSKQLKQIRKSSISRVICDNTDTLAIQPDAFLTNQTRINCYKLPSVSLKPWKENTCFISVKAPANQDIMGLSRLVYYYNTKNTVKTATYISKENSEYRCLPVLCPTYKRDLRLTILGVPDDAECSVFSSRFSLAGSNSVTISHKSKYSRIRYYQSPTRNGGVFNTVSACEWHVLNPSIEVKCDIIATDINPMNVTNNPESPEYEGSLPEDVSKQVELDFIASINNNGRNYNTKKGKNRVKDYFYYYWRQFTWK